MTYSHTAADLVQMQSLPLEAKIDLSKDRIKAWYESWMRFEIYNRKTKKTRYVAVDTRHDAMAEPRLTANEEIIKASPGAVYVSFSGGKDSTVLKHLVDSMYEDVPSVFCNTGLEYPEIQKFAMTQSNTTQIRPSMSFRDVLTTYGYPMISKEVSLKLHDARVAQSYGKETSYALRQLEGNYVSANGKTNTYNVTQWRYLLDAPFKISHKCCYAMKKSPARTYERIEGRKPILGTMASESIIRKSTWLKYGCNAYDKNHQSSTPLSFWTEQDILSYLKQYDVPYCSIYGDITVSADNQYATSGCDRTGCIFCGFGCHLEREPNRFQRLKITHPKQYDYCMGGGEWKDGLWQPSKEGLGLGYVLDYIGVPH